MNEFYLIYVLHTLRVISIIFSICAGCFSILGLIMYSAMTADGWVDKDSVEEKKFWMKMFKISLIVSIPCLLLSIIIPNEETMYAMLIFKHADGCIEQVKNAVDYIVESIKSLK